MERMAPMYQNENHFDVDSDGMIRTYSIGKCNRKKTHGAESAKMIRSLTCDSLKFNSNSLIHSLQFKFNHLFIH